MPQTRRRPSGKTKSGTGIRLSLPLWAFLIGLGAVIGGTRLHTYQEPIERDLSTYAVIGHEMLQGRNLYTDLWDHKPPGIYGTYALAEMIVGYGQQEFFFLGVLAAVLALLGLYRVGRAVSPAGGLWTALFWTLVCSDMLLQANQPNVEAFVNAAMVWSLVFLLPSPAGARNLLGSGTLLALAFWYKPQAIVFAFLFTGALFFLEPREGRLGRSFSNLVRLLFPSVLLGGMLTVHYLGAGGWRDLYGALVVYNRFYAGHQWANFINGFKVQNLFPDSLHFLAPLLALAFLAFLRFRTGYPRLWLLLAVYCAGTYYFVESTGRAEPHYYQLWLPIAVVAGGWGCALLGRWVGSFHWALAPVPALACLSFILFHEIPNYRLDADQWSQAKYGTIFTEARDLSVYLGGILRPGEDLANFTNDSEFYFYTRKSPPSGVINCFPAMNGPLAFRLMERLDWGMTVKKPALIVEDYPGLGNYYKRFLDEYDLWKIYPDPHYHYALLVRKDSDLHRRLEQPGVSWDFQPK